MDGPPTLCMDKAGGESGRGSYSRRSSAVYICFQLRRIAYCYPPGHRAARRGQVRRSGVALIAGGWRRNVKEALTKLSPKWMRCPWLEFPIPIPTAVGRGVQVERWTGTKWLRGWDDGGRGPKSHVRQAADWTCSAVSSALRTTHVYGREHNSRVQPPPPTESRLRYKPMS